MQTSNDLIEKGKEKVKEKVDEYREHIKEKWKKKDHKVMERMIPMRMAWSFIPGLRYLVAGRMVTSFRCGG